jgi:hypothetical protein
MHGSMRNNDFGSLIHIRDIVRSTSALKPQQKRFSAIH